MKETKMVYIHNGRHVENKMRKNEMLKIENNARLFFKKACQINSYRNEYVENTIKTDVKSQLFCDTRRGIHNA